MKRLFVMMLVLSAISMASAQSLKSLPSDDGRLRVSFSSGQLTIAHQQVQGGTYTVLSLSQGSFSQTVGDPQLPEYSRVVELPLCEYVKVNVLDAQRSSISHVEEPLLPRQPDRRKSDTLAHPFVINEAVYASDTLVGSPLVRVEPMGVARDRYLVRLTFSPVSYNPATGEVFFCDSIDAEVVPVGADFAKTSEMKQKYASPLFLPVPSLLNRLDAPKAETSAVPVRFLIVSHGSFRGMMDEFVEWKQRQGFSTDIVYTDEIGSGDGSSSTIAAYILDQYQNATPEMPAPTYLLLVGNIDKIPSFTSRVQSFLLNGDHVTDLYYATWTDDDIPDCYYGRFPASNETELAAMISKTLMYEQYAFPDPAYLDDAVLVAGKDNGRPGDNAYTYADPSMDYIAYNYVNQANGFSNIYYYKNQTSSVPDGVVVSGSSHTSQSAVQLRSLYDQGMGWINYSAHGNYNSWSTPSFTVANANSMTNSDKPSVMIGNCCLSCKFNSSSPCLGEAVLRRGDNAGAVVYVGATNYTYWTEDFYWTVGMNNSFAYTYSGSHLGMYDHLFHTHGEPFSEWRTTMGAMVAAGNMQVTSTYSLYYWEVYHLMGDPSLSPWLSRPAEMPLTYDEIIVKGTESTTIYTAPYAYVALIGGDGEPVAAVLADSLGVAELPIYDSLSVGVYGLSVSAQGYIPESAQVRLMTPGSFFVYASNFSPNGVVAGDTVDFNITIVNGDDTDYDQVSVLISANPTEVQMLSSDPIVLTNLHPGDTVVLQHVSPAVLSPRLADGQRVLCNVLLCVDGESECYRMGFKVASSTVKGHLESSTGVLHPESPLSATVKIENVGHAAAKDISLSLVDNYGMLSQYELPFDNIALLEPGHSVSLEINMTTSASMYQPLRYLPVDLLLNVNGKHSVVPISVSGSELDDFETGDFSHFDWENDQTYPWSVTNSKSYSGTYSACSYHFSGSGNRSSILTINIDVPYTDSLSYMRKVSSEKRFDFFTFYIDEVPFDEASGEEDWTRKSFEVAPGTHTLKFVYSKDASVNNGSDCAWIDDVRLPNASMPLVYTVDSVCASSRSDSPADSSYFTVDTVENVLVMVSHRLVAPEVSVLASAEEFVVGQPLLLVATGAQHYLWSTGDTTPSITIVPQSGDDIYVTVEGFIGDCSDVDSITLTARLLDIRSAQRDDVRALLYPNPTRDRLNVVADDLQQVVLFDCCGRVIRRVEASSSSLELSLQGLPNGVYFVRLTTSDASGVRKVVKQ